MKIPKCTRYLMLLGILCAFVAVMWHEPISVPLAHSIKQSLHKTNAAVTKFAYDSGVKCEAVDAVTASSSLFERRFGLYVLHEPRTEENTVNFIFVHGLGGSMNETWTHSSNTFWPTLLHNDERFTNSRISTFGYDANFTNIFMPKNALGIADFAKQLNVGLGLYYDKYGDAVIEAGIDPSYSRVHKNTRAIMFFGTPHRGADLSSLLSDLLSISFSKKIFVDQLRGDSELIQGINDQFRHRAQSLKLVSFHESTGVRGVGDSATLGFPEERILSLNANHMEMCKFDSTEDNNYIMVSGMLNEVLRDVLANSAQETKAGMVDVKIHYNEHQSIDTNNFVVPFERNPWFTGRIKFLENLQEILSDQAPKKYNHRIALYGIGGIGKTQTALEYVYANRGSYERIYWITAVDQASLLSGYRKIAIKAGLKRLLKLNPVDIAENVLAWLSQEHHWLLVIDNLDDINVVAGFLPPNGPHQHTLITTRNPNSRGIPAEGLEVPLLNGIDSINLLCTLSNKLCVVNTFEYVQASHIIEELGYLPLAIEQAAAYVREVAGDFATFLAHYHEIRPQIHDWMPQGNRQYPFSVATTWSMSFNIVYKNHPQAAKLFQLLSFLNPDGILMDFLAAAVQVLDSNLQMVVANPIDRAKALIELEKLSLIKWNRLTNTLVIHRLVQAVIRDEMARKEWMKLCSKIVDICDEAFPKEWNSDTQPICRTYFGQVLTPLLLAESLQTTKLADIMERVGSFLENDGKYNEGAKLLQGVVQIRAALNGSEDQSTLVSMAHLALIHQQQGKLTEAAKIQEEVLAKNTVIWGDKHPFTLASINNLAFTYHRQGKLIAAAKMHKEVLEKVKVMLGDDHPFTLTSMNNLALTYQQQGKLVESVKIQEEVLAKRRVILGGEHSDTLVSMHCLAVTYRQQGKLTEAVKIQEEVVAKEKVILGDDHPNTLTSIDNLAFVYQQQNKFTEAANMHKEVLAKNKVIWGDEHPSTLTSMHNLAWIYQQKGKLTEAAKMQEEVLQKRQVILGDEHPDTLAIMNNLAITYQKQGKLIEAAKMQEEVVAKEKVILGDDHPDTLTSINNLAFIYQQQEKFTEAAKMHEEVLAKRKVILGEDHPDTLTSMHNLAETCGKQGNLTEATKMHEEVLAKRKVILEEDHPDTLASMYNLAEMYAKQGKFTEAAKMYEEVLVKMKVILGEDHPDTLTIMYNLAETYGELGKFTEAVKMHKEVLVKTTVVLGEDHPDTLKSMHSLAVAYFEQGKFGQARSIFENVYIKRKFVLGETHPSTFVTKDWLDYISQIEP